MSDPVPEGTPKVPFSRNASESRGSYRLFHLFGIDVFVHWSWLVVAAFELQYRRSDYPSLVWNAAEYLTLFAIVLLHEFGHALACRSVGGKANRIMLWPLGGVAYVDPPQRPGPILWSIAAGPLVNLVLVPLTVGLVVLDRMGFIQVPPDASQYLVAVASMNVGLLVFNLLPAYPLDGGQILQALLWFVIGRARALAVVAVLGLLGTLGLLGLAISQMSFWIGFMALFMGTRSYKAFQHARSLLRLMREARDPQARCPACGEAAVAGIYNVTCRCGNEYEALLERGACPRCQAGSPPLPCVFCGRTSPVKGWYGRVL